MLKKLKKIISCIFVFLAYRICLSVLKLRGKLNAAVYQQQRARSIYRLHCFCRAMDNLPAFDRHAFVSSQDR